jgi:hypothetical protein
MNSGMAVLGEIVELLKRWDVWKRVEAAPERIDALEKRVAELEAKLRRAPGEACPSCGALAFRIMSSQPHPTLGVVGARVHHMKCEECGFTDQKIPKRKNWFFGSTPLSFPYEPSLSMVASGLTISLQ